MSEGPYSNHLARFMRARGLTDPGLARLLKPEISKQQIFNLRRGHRKLTVEWAQRLAPHLGVPWEELVTGSPSSPSDQERADLLAAYDALEDEQRRAIQTLIKGLVIQSAAMGDGIRGRPARLTTPAADRLDAPLPPQFVDRQEELAWLAFWRERNDAERREVLSRLDIRSSIRARA